MASPLAGNPTGSVYFVPNPVTEDQTYACIVGNELLFPTAAITLFAGLKRICFIVENAAIGVDGSEYA